MKSVWRRSAVGCKVKILELQVEPKIGLSTRLLVPQRQTALKGKISNESPVGRALLGKKVGNTITVRAQAGELSYKVPRDPEINLRLREEMKMAGQNNGKQGGQ